MAKTLKEQQAYIGQMLGKYRAYLKADRPTTPYKITQGDIDCLDAIYGNLKMIEVELAETKAEAEEAARPGEGPTDNLGEDQDHGR